MKKFLNRFYLDIEKDIQVDIYTDDGDMYYILSTPNHHTGNLISNIARVSKLKVKFNDAGLKIINEKLPAFYTDTNRKVYILRLGDTKVATIHSNGEVEKKASIPAIAKTLMSQTKNYDLSLFETLVKTYIPENLKFKTDLHAHINGNLNPEVLIALGIFHQIKYPNYYVKKLNLKLNSNQEKLINEQREKVAKNFVNSELKGKYLDRKIDDNTFINFADLILNNIENSEYNLSKIKLSLSILKDSQAVFTNLEKLFLYRYVFTKAEIYKKKIKLKNIDLIPNDEIKAYLCNMILDHTDRYKDNTLFMDKLLWIGRFYSNYGINYVELSDTSLLKGNETTLDRLNQIHKILPLVEQETGCKIRFLAAFRRTPFNLINDRIEPNNYLRTNLNVLKVVYDDPYVVGSDIVGEEFNDIEELEPLIKEIVKYCKMHPDFILRIHAGENDSLKDNVYNSIKVVKRNLAKGQPFPHMRLGHGLYTANLKSKEGIKLIKALKDNNVILEFQISSNVRLNNLTNLKNHPIKQYLSKGIKCVQGSDGCGLYGTTPIEEEIALINLLKVSNNDLLKMKEVENELVEIDNRRFKSKLKKYNKEKFEKKFIETINRKNEENFIDTDKLVTKDVLRDKIADLPLDKLPIIVAGGSFNTENRTSKVTYSDKKHISKLLKDLNPNEVFFVVGHKVSAHEEYLIKENRGRFNIFAIVPSLITKKEFSKLNKAKVKIDVSIESLGMGIYKSFNYEIFERRPSVVIVFDGNSAAANLIQEAKNGKSKAWTLINANASSLKEKSKFLTGYVTVFKANTNIVPIINKFKKKVAN